MCVSKWICNWKCVHNASVFNSIKYVWIGCRCMLSARIDVQMRQRMQNAFAFGSLFCHRHTCVMFICGGKENEGTNHAHTHGAGMSPKSWERVHVQRSRGFMQTNRCTRYVHAMCTNGQRVIWMVFGASFHFRFQFSMCTSSADVRAQHGERVRVFRNVPPLTKPHSAPNIHTHTHSLSMLFVCCCQPFNWVCLSLRSVFFLSLSVFTLTLLSHHFPVAPCVFALLYSICVTCV